MGTFPHDDAKSLTPRLDPVNPQVNPRNGQSRGAPAGIPGPRESLQVPAGPAWGTAAYTSAAAVLPVFPRVQSSAHLPGPSSLELIFGPGTGLPLPLASRDHQWCKTPGLRLKASLPSPVVSFGCRLRDWPHAGGHETPVLPQQWPRTTREAGVAGGGSLPHLAPVELRSL